MIIPFKKARSAHLRLGKRGEDAACCLLREKKMEILLRNYRRKQGEIDIIARDGAIICFVEVKTRHKTSGARPAANLSLKQKRRIYRSAMRYLREIGEPTVVYRFDLVEVIYAQLGVCEIRHWPGNFSKKSIYRGSASLK